MWRTCTVRTVNQAVFRCIIPWNHPLFSYFIAHFYLYRVSLWSYSFIYTHDLNPKFWAKKNLKKNHKRDIMQLFCPWKVKKPPSKVATKYSNWFFSLLSWAAQTAQTEEFVFQNVAYWPTVYKTRAQYIKLAIYAQNYE